MARGGARPGAGRPAGSATRKTREIANRAAASGMLPHEFLLAVVRGDVIGGVTPTFGDRLEAAKAAAPYFAPKLSSVDVTTRQKTSAADFSDAELLAMLAETPEGKAVIEARGGAGISSDGIPEWAHAATKLKQ